jgi:glucose-1-phosphate cytidylyltransferase
MEKNINNDKWALVLCGGKGSRLGDLMNEIPKPLVYVHEKPIIWYTLWTLYSKGFRNFILPLGYKGEMIESYLRKETSIVEKCNIIFLDTGQDTSIAKRIDQVKKNIPENENFFILNSDTLFDFNIDAMLDLHIKNNALVTLASVDVISTWGLILFKNNSISGFERERKVRHLFTENKEEKGLVYSGFSWINKLALNEINLRTCNDFESDLYQKVIKMNRSAHFSLDGLWFPIDTKKDLDMINLSDDIHSSGFNAKKHKIKLEKTS